MRKVSFIFILFFVGFLNIFADNQVELNIKDRITINKIVNSIQKIVDEKWISYRNLMINSLKSKLWKSKENTKENKIFKELVQKVQKISFLNYSNNHYNSYWIDINKVKQTWLNRHNEVRKNVWANAYSYSDTLDNTAFERSWMMKEKWIMEHKRAWSNKDYDYSVMENWFSERWVKCKYTNKTSFTESIWKFWYYCYDDNCTDKMLESLKAIFDIYVAEKWKSYDLHYKAIVLKDLKKIWMWLSIYETNEKNYYEFYVTTHYCTEFID